MVFVVGVLVAVLIGCIRYSLGDGPVQGVPLAGLIGSGAGVASGSITAFATRRRGRKSRRGEEATPDRLRS
jgi:hypothetical protein